MGGWDWLFGTPDKEEVIPLTGEENQRNAAIQAEVAKGGDYLTRIKKLYDLSDDEVRMITQQAQKGMGQQFEAERASTTSLLAKRKGGLQGAMNYLMAQQQGERVASGDALGKLYANLAMQRKGLQQQGLGQEMALGERNVNLLGASAKPQTIIREGTSGLIGPLIGAAGTILGGPLGGVIGGAIGGAMKPKSEPRPAGYSNLATGSEMPDIAAGQPEIRYYAKGGPIRKGTIGMMAEHGGAETLKNAAGKTRVGKATFFASVANGMITPDAQGRHGRKGKAAGRAGAAASGAHRRAQGSHGWKGQLKRKGA